MGKITNMQQKQNKENGVNLSYARGQVKPRLRVKGIKDIGTLLGPNGGKYRLSKDQRNFQLGGRLTIAAIASALAIAGGVSYANHQPKQDHVVEASSQENMLTKEDVLSQAEEKLVSFVCPDATILGNVDVEYLHDSELQADMILIYQRLNNPNAEPIKRFSYTRYNLLEDFSLHARENAPEVVRVLNDMISVNMKENPSQHDLYRLMEEVSNWDLSKFELEGNHIVESSQRDLGEER